MAYTGSLKEIAFKKEGTRGTIANPASGDWKAHKGFDFAPKITKVEDTSGLGSIVSRNQANVSQEWSEGSVGMNLPLSFLGDLTNMIMGQAPTTTGTGTYTHSWTLLNANNHLSYTISTVDPVAGDKQYKNAVLSDVTIAYTTDDYINATMNFMAGKEASASLTPAYNATDTLFRPQDATVKIATNFAGLAGASAICIKSLNLTITKNTDADYCLGSTEASDFYNQRITVSGDMTFTYNSDTYRALGLADTSKALQIELTSGTNSWKLQLPSVDFQDWSDSNELDSYLQNTVSFNANFLDKTNGILKAVLVNTTASY